jgi:hypothetical protein
MTKCSARADDKRNSSCEIVPAVHLNSLKVGGACLCDNSLHSRARSLVFIYTDGAKSQPPPWQMLKNTHALLLRMARALPRSFIILDASFAEGCFLDELAAVRAASLTLINAN